MRSGARGAGAVDVRDRGIRVRRIDGDVGATEAHRRYGGVDVPATLAGMLAALGTAVLLAGLFAAAGSYGYQQGIDGAEELSAAGLLAGFATLAISFLIGGWVAGRMARYDGARNGVVTALWFLLLAAIMAGLGAWVGDRYDVFRSVRLPQWFGDDARSLGALASGLAAVLLMVLAGWLGGHLGARYHRRADALIAGTREGGVAEARNVRVR